MNVTEYILNNDAPDNKVALLTSQGDYTYADLKRGVDRVANYLVQYARDVLQSPCLSILTSKNVPISWRLPNVL
jgi:hypothetical protein